MEFKGSVRSKSNHEMRENREKFVWSVSLCSYYSCCSRFMVLNRSVRSNFHREMHENLRKFVWSASPCSYRSRCSRFMFLKRSVRCNFHREAREKREQKRECPQEDLTAKCAKTANKKKSVRWKPKGSVHYNFHRETRENHESLYGLLLLVRTLRVVRGSRF